MFFTTSSVSVELALSSREQLTLIIGWNISRVSLCLDLDGENIKLRDYKLFFHEYLLIYGIIMS